MGVTVLCDCPDRKNLLEGVMLLDVRFRYLRVWDVDIQVERLS